MSHDVRDREIRNASMLCAENDFLVERFIKNKPGSMRIPLRKQYSELLKNSRPDLIENLSWCYHGRSLDSVMGLDGSIAFRKEESTRLGGPSKQAIAYFIVKKQFENYEFLK